MGPERMVTSSWTSHRLFHLTREVGVDVPVQFHILGACGIYYMQHRGVEGKKNHQSEAGQSSDGEAFTNRTPPTKLSSDLHSLGTCVIEGVNCCGETGEAQHRTFSSRGVHSLGTSTYNQIPDHAAREFQERSEQSGVGKFIKQRKGIRHQRLGHGPFKRERCCQRECRQPQDMFGRVLPRGMRVSVAF